MLRKLATSGLMVIVCLSLSGQAGGGEKLPFTISKETTNIVRPLRADGTVDYLRALNEKHGKGVTPENNGYVAWLKVVGTGKEVMAPIVKTQSLKMIGAEEAGGAKVWQKYEDFLSQERGLSGETLEASVKGLHLVGGDLWKAEEHPEVAAFLKSREVQLGQMVDVISKRDWWLPYVQIEADPSFMVTLPSLVFMREAGATLVARGMLRMNGGDFEGFLADVTISKKFARQVGSGATLIEQLVGVAIDRHATAAIGTVVGRGVLTERQCAQVLAVLDELRPLPQGVDIIDAGERLCALDIVMAIAKRDVRSISKIDNGELLQKLGKIDRDEVDWDVVLRLANKEYDDIVRALRTANFATMTREMELIIKRQANVHPDAMGERKAGEPRNEYSIRVGTFILLEIVPNFWKADVLQRWAKMEEEMLRAVMAAAIHRARKGEWPKALSDIAPDLLQKVPLDMHSNNAAEAVKYRISADGIRIYSVGQNTVDEEGRYDEQRKRAELILDDLGIGVKFE